MYKQLKHRRLRLDNIQVTLKTISIYNTRKESPRLVNYIYTYKNYLSVYIYTYKNYLSVYIYTYKNYLSVYIYTCKNYMSAFYTSK